MRNRSFLFFLGIAAAGCGSGGGGYTPEEVKPVDSATLKAGEEASLFPFAIGNQWTYTGVTRQRIQGRVAEGKFDITFKIVKVMPSAGGEVAEVEITSDAPNSKKDLQRWERNSKGLFQTAVGNPLVPFNPPQPIVMFPLEAGRKFSWKGTGITPIAKPGNATINGEIMPSQEVFSETERYSGFGVTSRGTFTSGTANGTVESTAYWVPKVGLVRYVQEVVSGQNAGVQTLTLKAKTVR